MAGRLVLGFALALLPLVTAQGGSPPSSYPHDYSNKPTSPLGPSWQNYFKVNTQLPGVNFPLKSSYAGNLAVNRPNHPNNTLFFWGFEKTTGSLALNTPANRAPWTIWLNGGPGSSSFYGFFFENGPIRIQSDGSIVKNQYSWDGLSDIFWIDQPVGVGYSTADSDGYVPDQDQIGRDFMGFLENLVKVFPGLKNRPLVLAGESYAGMYIPYILKTYFGMSNPPVKVDKIMIGDPTITSGVVFNLLPTLSVIETFPQLIGYDPEVYKYFKQQSHLCNYDVNLTYPQTGGLIPDVPVRQPRDREIPWLSMQTFTKAQFFRTLAKRHEDSIADGLTKRDRLVERDTWKRSVAGRPTDSIDPWYGCFVWDAVLDYAVNFTYPWNEDAGLNVYDVADALWPEPNHDAAPFMNNPQVRAALHAPQSKDWALQFPFVFGSAGRDDPSPFSMTFMSELATNASAKNVGIVLASGNNDMLIAHLSTEIAIQNTTFGGIQGFTKKPSTPWNDDSGKFAGIVHQERGWTYALFYGTGHMIPSGVPQAAYKFFRDWVLGNSPIGKVAGNSVIGGSDDRFKGQNIPAGPEIYLGAGVTQSTYIAPQATRAAWDSFLRTETANRYGARTAPTPAPGGPPRPPTSPGGPGGPPGPTPTRHHRALRDVSES